MTAYLFTSRGDSVSYDLRGDGPAVVFVVGAGPFRAIDPQTDETAQLLAQRGFTTVVHDRVGRADSFREGRVQLADELAAVRAMVDVAGGRAVLCGHSSGCAVALRAAVEGLPVGAGPDRGAARPRRDRHPGVDGGAVPAARPGRPSRRRVARHEGHPAGGSATR